MSARFPVAARSPETASAPELHCSVSALVPSHEHCRYLPARFDSIAAQTRAPDEVLVLDDHSSDGSAAWLKSRHSHPPLRHIAAPRRIGNPFGVWNALAAQATGDWLWIAESDDASHPDFLRTLLAAAACAPTAAIVFCQSERIDADGNVLGSFRDFTDHYDTETWGSDFVLEGRTAATRLLLPRNVIPNVSACLLSRRAWLAAGGAANTLSLCGDWLTYGRLLEHGPLVFCAAALNQHRHHPHTQRARTSPSDYVAQSYTVRRLIAERHGLAPSDREHARRYAWHETSGQFPVPLCDLPEALSQDAREAALAFDPLFVARAQRPALQHWNRCDVFCSASGQFSDAYQRRQPVPVYDQWTTLTFSRCTGAVRIDPISHPGRCAVRRISLCASASGAEIWRTDAARETDELKTNPGVSTTCRDGAWWLETAHEDPQIWLPVDAARGAANFDVVIELLCPLE